MRESEVRARTLSPNDCTGDAPTIPPEVLDVLNSAEGDSEQSSAEEEQDDGGTDKAATPAERIRSEAELVRNCGRMRPLTLLAQRDSDANKRIEESRNNALATVASVDIQTGSNLEEQFQTDYIPRVFSVTFPFCVSGPDFKNSRRLRRQVGESAFLDLDNFTAMCSQRVEAQMRWDWDLNPGLWSLAFASKVNLSVSMSYNRVLRRHGYMGEEEELGIGQAAQRI